MADPGCRAGDTNKRDRSGPLRHPRRPSRSISPTPTGSSTSAAGASWPPRWPTSSSRPRRPARAAGGRRCSGDAGCATRGQVRYSGRPNEWNKDRTRLRPAPRQRRPPVSGSSTRRSISSSLAPTTMSGCRRSPRRPASRRRRWSTTSAPRKPCSWRGRESATGPGRPSSGTPSRSATSRRRL